METENSNFSGYNRRTGQNNHRLLASKGVSFYTFPVLQRMVEGDHGVIFAVFKLHTFIDAALELRRFAA